jgi:S1-C subfamily serine protease
MQILRHPLAVAAPGVAALVLALVALGRDDGEGRRVETRTAAGAPAAPAPAPGFAALYERVDGVVARVEARRGAQDPPLGNGRRTATGAAFLVDGDGHVVTNAHVVAGARSASLRFGRATRRIPARIVGRDRTSDLAVLRVDPDRVRGEEPLALAPPESIEVGDPVLAVGTPFRLQSSASAGIVSATGRVIRGLNGLSIPDSVQTDAAINPGNSGGPLVDGEGRVVGVNSQGRAAGVGFAVSSTTMRRVLPQLIEDGRAETAYLGVSLGDDGRIESVRDGGPADRAGIRNGDVIVRIDGRAGAGEGAVASAVAARRPGDRVEIELRRRTVTVRLGSQPSR